ncbi:hypothetical protein ACQP1P_38460 [Dactylosporangium sp. CA-052675]|uniref:hypothetical protein n=1 Tax=Dactylosporangium sp. CA-052675 TaxID=3239927 RepID=UPI003D93FF1A
MPELDNAIELDIRATARVIEEDGGLVLLLEDEHGGRVRFAMRRDPASFFAVRRLALLIEHQANEVRRLSIGYREGPVNGPTPWPSL